MAVTVPVTPFEPSADRVGSRPRPAVRRSAAWPDVLFSSAAHGAALLTLSLLAAIIVALFIGAAPAIREYGLGFLTSSVWDPVQNRYGGRRYGRDDGAVNHTQTPRPRR